MRKKDRPAVGEKPAPRKPRPADRWPAWTDAPFIALVGYPGIVAAPPEAPPRDRPARRAAR